MKKRIATIVFMIIIFLTMKSRINKKIQPPDLSKYPEKTTPVNSSAEACNFGTMLPPTGSVLLKNVVYCEKNDSITIYHLWWTEINVDSSCFYYNCLRQKTGPAGGEKIKVNELFFGKNKRWVDWKELSREEKIQGRKIILGQLKNESEK